MKDQKKHLQSKLLKRNGLGKSKQKKMSAEVYRERVKLLLGEKWQK